MREVLVIQLGDVDQSLKDFGRKRKQTYQSAIMEGMSFIFIHFLLTEMKHYKRASDQ